MTIFTDCHYRIPFKQTNHTLSEMTDLPAPGQRTIKKQLSINKLEFPSSAILPHGLERASAALRYAPKDFPALQGDQCPIGLHLAGSFLPSSPNAATPRYTRTSRRLLMFVCVPISQRTLYFRGRVRTSPFAANLTLLGDLGGKAVANCRRSRLACLLVIYGNFTLISR